MLFYNHLTVLQRITDWSSIHSRYFASARACYDTLEKQQSDNKQYVVRTPRAIWCDCNGSRILRCARDEGKEPLSENYETPVKKIAVHLKRRYLRSSRRAEAFYVSYDSRWRLQDMTRMRCLLAQRSRSISAVFIPRGCISPNPARRVTSMFQGIQGYVKINDW